MASAISEKRPTVACCAIMKNESPYIHEWVAHYTSLGFDEIAIYENDSSDRTPYLLSKLQENGHITYFKWPSLDRKSPQISAYEDYIKQTDCDWVLFCDADEFLILNEHDNVSDFISEFSDDITCISVNWHIFGSSNLEKREKGLVIQRFQYASQNSFEINRHVKSFVRPSSVVNMHIHAPETSGSTVYSDGSPLHFSEGNIGIAPGINLNKAAINHYFTKTKEEWEVKKNRGNANRSINARDKFIRYHQEMFTKHDKNDIHLPSALKYEKNILKLVDIYLGELDPSPGHRA